MVVHQGSLMWILKSLK